LGDLLAQVEDLRDGLGGDLGPEVLELVGFLGELSLDRLADVDRLVDVVSDTLEVLRTHATASHGGGTDTDTAGGKGRLVTGDGVLVAGNVDLLKNGLDTSTIQGLGAKVQENHVAVGTVGDELVAQGLELFLKSLGVLDHLLLVLLELRGGSVLERNRKSGDGVVVGTTLVARENGEVNGALKVIQDVLAGLGVGVAYTLAEEDHGTTGTTERLVGSGGDNIGVLEGRGDNASSNQTGDVSHVHNEIGADLVSDLAHAGIVNQTAVGGSTSDQALRAVELGIGLEGVVVDDTGLEVDAVGEGFEVSRDSGNPGQYGKLQARTPG
jgi:hypothetical protein